MFTCVGLFFIHIKNRLSETVIQIQNTKQYGRQSCCFVLVFHNQANLWNIKYKDNLIRYHNIKEDRVIFLKIHIQEFIFYSSTLVGHNVWLSLILVGHFQFWVGQCPMSDRYFKPCLWLQDSLESCREDLIILKYCFLTVFTKHFYA